MSLRLSRRERQDRRQRQWHEDCCTAPSVSDRRAIEKQVFREKMEKDKGKVCEEEPLALWLICERRKPLRVEEGISFHELMKRRRRVY